MSQMPTQMSYTVAPATEPMRGLTSNLGSFEGLLDNLDGAIDNIYRATERLCGAPPPPPPSPHPADVKTPTCHMERMECALLRLSDLIDSLNKSATRLEAVI